MVRWGTPFIIAKMVQTSEPRVDLWGLTLPQRVSLLTQVALGRVGLCIHKGRPVRQTSVYRFPRKHAWGVWKGSPPHSPPSCILLQIFFLRISSAERSTPSGCPLSTREAEGFVSPYPKTSKRKGSGRHLPRNKPSISLISKHQVRTLIAVFSAAYRFPVYNWHVYPFQLVWEFGLKQILIRAGEVK